MNFIDLLLINSRYLFRKLFITTPKKCCMRIQTSWETNHEIKTNIYTCFWYWRWKNVFFNVKLKLLINFDFSQFHQHIFRSSRMQMFFKIGALKNFTILRIKKRLQQRCFFCKKRPLGGVLKGRCSLLQANVNILINFLFKMLE